MRLSLNSKIAVGLFISTTTLLATSIAHAKNVNVCYSTPTTCADVPLEQCAVSAVQPNGNTEKPSATNPWQACTLTGKGPNRTCVAKSGNPDATCVTVSPTAPAAHTS